jgi:hypothetical protein
MLPHNKNHTFVSQVLKHKRAQNGHHNLLLRSSAPTQLLIPAVISIFNIAWIKNPKFKNPLPSPSSPVYSKPKWTSIPNFLFSLLADFECSPTSLKPIEFFSSSELDPFPLGRQTRSFFRIFNGWVEGEIGSDSSNFNWLGLGISSNGWWGTMIFLSLKASGGFSKVLDSISLERSKPPSSCSRIGCTFFNSMALIFGDGSKNSSFLICPVFSS